MNQLELDQLMWTYVGGDLPADNGFKCRWYDCFIGVRSPDELDLHLEKHVSAAIENWQPGTVFQCGIFGCQLQCTTASDLRAHVKHHLHHAITQRNGLKLLRQNLTNLTNCGFPPCPVLQTPEEPLMCEWNYCSCSCPDICAFVQHCKEHVRTAGAALFSDNKYYFVCQWEGCQGGRFLDRYDLERHLNTHTRCKTCACPFCGRYISSASRLIDHVNRNVEGSENFLCFLCNKTFASQRLLREHCERHVRTVQCPECPLVLQRESDLKAHVEAVHQKNRQFFCQYCSRSYMKKSDLTKHMTATHGNGNAFRCPQCEMDFTWQKQLKHHLLTHEPNYIKSPYLCHICGSTYQRGSALSKHLRTFHKLTVPHGFTRFQFKKCQDKMYRLETQRVISDELKHELAQQEIQSAGPASIPMLHRRLLRVPPHLLPSSSCRQLSFTQNRRLLSQEFALKDKWAKRFDDLQRYQLGGSYEWITSVQKKFVGDGKASAVDVDSAVCLAQEEDQIEDVTELVYKLRHTENTGDSLESTEYGLVRLLLKWGNTQLLFKVLRDPINYGIFMNEHAYCFTIDYLLKQENITGAAEVATHVMKQECFDNELLNLLSVYSLLKWLELPAEQRVFDNQPKEQEVEEGEHVMEEEEIMFKFPFLRPEYNDGHFDLEDPFKLVCKSLEWFRPHLKSDLSGEIAHLLQKIHEHQGEEPFKCETHLSDKVLAILESSKRDLEAKLIEKQAKLFDEWSDRRHKLIETQAKTLNLQLRLEELKLEEEMARTNVELLQFFDNRVKWESTAKEKMELFAELRIGQDSEELTEEVYARTMFDRMRDRVSSVQKASK